MKAINGMLFDKDGTLMSFDCFWRGVIHTLDALPALIASINRRCALSLWEPQYSL